MASTRVFSALLFAMLIAACSSAPAGRDTVESRPFVSEDRDPTLGREDPTSPDLAAEGTALSTEERAKAAMLLYELAGAGEDNAKRTATIEKLVKLGPRYVTYLRSIEEPAIELDLVYVISRIEEQSRGAVERPAPESKTPDKAPEKTPDQPRRRGAGSSEGIEEAPHYGDEAGQFDREQVERFLAQRLANARQALASGDHENAQKIAQAALTLMPDSRLRPDFEDVILQARAQGQASTLIAGTLSLDPMFLQYNKRERGGIFVTPLTVKCFLKNVSSQVISLTLSDGPGRESVVELNVRYEQLDYQGNSLATEGRVLLPVAAQGVITLQPNDSYELSVDLAGLSSLDADGPVKYTLGNVAVKAALRVYGASDAENRPMILRPITFPSRTAKVFPSEFDLAGAQQRPIQALSDALSKNRPQDLFMAAQLVEKKQLRAVGDLLLGDDLETCALGLQRARMKAMAALTGSGATFDAKKWRAWWAENKFRY